MTESPRLKESDHEASEQVDGLKRTPNVSPYSCSIDKSPDYAACEEKHAADPSQVNKNAQSLHQRMDPSNEQRKGEDDLEYVRRTNLNIQSAMAAQDAFLRAGYDMRPYYGWLPGIAASPLRFPAFIYPQTFFDIARQNADVNRKEQSNGLNRDTSEIWDESKAESEQRKVERGTTFQGHNGFLAQKDDFEKAHMNNNTHQHDAKSDVDEGLELDDYDSKSVPKTLMRRGSPEPGELSPTQVATTVSVIQENCTAQKSTEYTRDDGPDECSETEETIKRLAKRGRASTRRIEKTEQYWDRRKKNNVSAKKSRDARRQREIVTNQRSAMLEAENLRLRAEVATLKDENERLKKN